MNQQVQEESVTGVQEDKQVEEQVEQRTRNKEETIIQSISDELLQVKKEKALKQRIHQLYTLFSQV